MLSKNFIVIGLCGLLSAILLTCCDKNSKRTSVDAYIFNDGIPVNHADLYLKFGTDKEPPNPTVNYDQKIHGNEGNNQIHIENLRTGNYFLFAVGINSLSVKTVKGGTAISISKANLGTPLSFSLEVH